MEFDNAAPIVINFIEWKLFSSSGSKFYFQQNTTIKQ